MQLPITIGLHRSFLGLAAIAIAHGVAIAGIVATPWALPVKAGLLAGLGGLLLICRRFGENPVKALRLLADGGVQCRLAGEDSFQAAELVPGGTVHPWLTTIGLRVEGRRVFAVVLPDSIATEDFRRLRVWLRWRADFSRGSAPV